MNNNVVLVSVNNTEESKDGFKPTVSQETLVPSDIRSPSDLPTLTKENPSGFQSRFSNSPSLQPVYKSKSLTDTVYSKDGKYEFQEQFGVYYDSFEIIPHILVKSEHFVVGQSKPILLFVLSDETEWNATKPIDRAPEWYAFLSLLI